MAKLTAEILEGFTNTVLRKNFDDPADTPEFHREMWRYLCSDHKQVAIAAPRSHAKSTAGTHAFVLASILFRDASYVLVVSDTVSQAVQFLGDMKRELLDNEDLRNLFGVEAFLKDTEDDLIVSMDDGHKFRIQAKGSEQRVRGLKWESKRPDLIVGDDLENDEIVMNKDRRAKFKRWFFGALLPAKSDKGRIRLVGTILHLDSLLENLMPGSQLGITKQKALIREDLKEYTDVRLPWKSIKYRAHTDDFSKILWPQKKTAAEFRSLRDDYIKQGLADVYSQEMLNIPLDESDTFFRKNDFLPIKKEDREKKLNYYVAADLAISQRERSDYTVFTVAGIDDSGRIQLVNVIRDRFDSLQIVDTILMLHKLYKPELIGIESGAIQKAIGPYLNEAMVSQDTYPHIVLLKPSGDKITRARSMQARMRAGATKFDKEADWYQAFEDELLRFPRDKHDDQVDAWAYIGLMLDKMIVALSPEEEEEEEYRLSLKDQPQGRNLVTGY